MNASNIVREVREVIKNMLSEGATKDTIEEVVRSQYGESHVIDVEVYINDLQEGVAPYSEKVTDPEV